MIDVILGADGRARCEWALSAPEYIAYHDTEWGVPLHGDSRLFERLCLESFQSGLSWLVILRKRKAFRRAFAKFDPATVAEFGPDRVAKLMADASIVRNRAKIEAAIHNARIVRDLVPGLDELLWSFAPTDHESPRPSPNVTVVTPASTAMAKELKRRGFAFVGPTTCYALMQATGMVNDHLVGCWRSGIATEPHSKELPSKELPPKALGLPAGARRRRGKSR